MRAVLATVLTSVVLVRHVARRLRDRFGRPPRRIPPPSFRPATNALDISLPTENGRTLRGWFVPATSEDRPSSTALVMHGWGASAADMAALVGPLRATGLNVLLLDARCHGRSDDDDFSSMPRFAEDIRAGLDWLRRRPEVDGSRIVLVGHSVGAGACLYVASSDPDVAAVVSIASMAHPQEFMARALRNHFPSPLVGLALRFVERTIGQRFETFAPIHTIGRVRAPVLLVHGARDETVGIEDAYALRSRAQGPVTLHVAPAADHTNVEALTEVAPVLIAFLRDMEHVATA